MVSLCDVLVEPCSERLDGGPGVSNPLVYLGSVHPSVGGPVLNDCGPFPSEEVDAGVVGRPAARCVFQWLVGAG